MTDIISAAAARDHLRVGSGVTDAMLAPLIVAAQGRIESFLGRDLIGDAGWADATKVPPIVAHAVKLALSDFYVNREAPALSDDQLRPMIGRFIVVSIA